MTGNSAQKASHSYLLPVEDVEFLLRDEMRPTRFALEFAKADLCLRDWGVRSTVVVFGSARVRAPDATPPPSRPFSPFWQASPLHAAAPRPRPRRRPRPPRFRSS